MKDSINKIRNNKDKKQVKSMGLLVINGSIRDPQLIKRIIENNYLNIKEFFIAAADGGASNCSNLRLVPDVIIGDMDSITAKVVGKFNNENKEIKFINFSPDKDESDTQLALEYLIDLGFKKIIMVGAFGSRADHSFANLVLLSSPAYEGIDIRIVTDNSEIIVTRKSCSIKGFKGSRVSLFSLTPYTFFEKTAGLKYKLKNEKLFFSPVRGLSNEFTRDNAKIYFKDGIVMIVKEIKV